MSRAPITRRSFVAGTAALAAVGPEPLADDGPPARQATGTRVGEVTADSAVVWTRLTAHLTRNTGGVTFGKGDKEKGITVPVERLEGAYPGADGRVRVRYGTREDLGDATATAWAGVTARGVAFRHHDVRGTVVYGCEFRPK
jgi:phosphodiesterase/alkaline phosphatase D-like protein